MVPLGPPRTPSDRGTLHLLSSVDECCSPAVGEQIPRGEEPGEEQAPRTSGALRGPQGPSGARRGPPEDLPPF